MDNVVLRNAPSCKNDDWITISLYLSRIYSAFNIYDFYTNGMSTVCIKKTTLRSETDERNKIQEKENHFRNQWTLPLCHQPIQQATLSAPTEMPMGQTTVKPFAISDFDSPTFFKGEIKTRMGPLFKAKKEAVAFVDCR